MYINIDNSVIIWLAFVTAHFGYISSLCDQQNAFQCLSDAQMELDAVAQDQRLLSEFCSNYMRNPQVSTCVTDHTRTCDKGVKDSYRIQASHMLKQLSDTCSYLEMQYAHEQTNSGQYACDGESLLSCHAKFNQIFDSQGWNNGQKKTLAELFQYMNPTVPIYFDQQNICSNIEDLDFVSVKACVNRTGCGNESVLRSGPTLTISRLLDLTNGICQPGCDSIEQRLRNATDCFQFKQRIVTYLSGQLEQNDIIPDCSEVDSILKCIRSHINMCEAAKDYLLLKLQIPAVDDNILDNCPDINLSLTDSRGCATSLLERNWWTFTFILIVFHTTLN